MKVPSPFLASTRNDHAIVVSVLNIAELELSPDQSDPLPLTSRRTNLHSVIDCSQEHDVTRPCACSYDVCVGWYPCGLKYCKGADSVGKTVNYRCGIKTCKKCRTFVFHTARKLNCMWNDDSLQNIDDVRLPVRDDADSQRKNDIL